MIRIPTTYEQAEALFASIDPDWLTSLGYGLGALAVFAAAFALALALASIRSGAR